MDRETVEEIKRHFGVVARLSYGELDRRVTGLETEVADPRVRLERVEKRLPS